MMSCQHFPKSSMFNFLLHQLLEISSEILSISMSFQCSPFKLCIRVWVPQKLAIAKTNLGGPGGRTYTFTPALRIGY